MISHINLGVKHVGKRSAGKLHAAFDEAGAGNGLTAPALDPTTARNKCINHIVLLGISVFKVVYLSLSPF